jgi:hypothetical protein
LHFHKTPYAVVKLLKKHVPSSAKKILDPAVGEGALLGLFAFKGVEKI